MSIEQLLLSNLHQKEYPDENACRWASKRSLRVFPLHRPNSSRELDGIGLGPRHDRRQGRGGNNRRGRGDRLAIR